MMEPTRTEACGLDRVTVGAVSQTLVQLGVVIEPNVKNLSILNVGNNDIFVAFNRAATAADFTAPAFGGSALRIGNLSAVRLQFMSPAGSDMNVQQMGDE